MTNSKLSRLFASQHISEWKTNEYRSMLLQEKMHCYKNLYLFLHQRRTYWKTQLFSSIFACWYLRSHKIFALNMFLILLLTLLLYWTEKSNLFTYTLTTGSISISHSLYCQLYDLCIYLHVFKRGQSTVMFTEKQHFSLTL